MKKRAMTKIERRLVSALNWALGTNGNFRLRGDWDGPFWWRTELAARSGLRIKNGKYRIPVKEAKNG